MAEPRVIREVRPVFRVPGGSSRLTKRAAYREAARVAIRDRCDCVHDGDGYNEPYSSTPCRYHGERLDGFAFDHPAAAASRQQPLCDGSHLHEPGETHGERGFTYDDCGGRVGDGGRAYYLLVRERLARWLRWADGVREAHKLIDDGHGNQWERCERVDCGLEVVRPGKVQCTVCEDGGA